MNKRLAALFITIFFLFSALASCYAAESWETWSTKTTDNPYKDWTVEFSKYVSSDTVNSSKIFITDSTGNNIPAEISISENKINIKPEHAYVAGESYYLYISKDIQSGDGESLQSGIRMPFVYEEEYDEVIHFADPNLEAVVRGTIGKPTGEIYRSDVQNITELYADLSDIKNIEGVQYLSNLEHLGLFYNDNISDISALSNLSNLKSLQLGNNNIEDLSPLANLTNLERLYLGNNNISDISCLSNLKNLKYLDLHNGKATSYNHNDISDISPLSNLTKLEMLHLFNNGISDISALSSLTNLKYLWLGYNNISDYSPIDGYRENLKNNIFEDAF
ncbi:MAG: hypothetical protein GT589_01360 [Peptoclostridium sp.]|uniref:leucine-rich repeat domain-containing protein n=1 Tax=Peptoclostridium sp. TaxID=1904860 RepID=UPI00139B032D|nr:leucine-rich repeat domain-containing protein [Peptoclostridium sp.]MZQ74792.1 hypothetical protein [Peptoclostridium sp.]